MRWRTRATPWFEATASSMKPMSLNWGPLCGSGQSSPAVSNQGFHGSSGLRSNTRLARCSGRVIERPSIRS